MRSAGGFSGGGEHEVQDFVRQAGHQTSPATGPPVTGCLVTGPPATGKSQGLWSWGR